MVRAVSDHVNDTGIDGYLREDRIDRFRRAVQLVTACDQHPLDTVTSKLSQDRQPGFNSIGALRPKAQHLPVAVHIDAESNVDALVPDGAFVATLQGNYVADAPGTDRFHRAELPDSPLILGGLGCTVTQSRRDLDPVQSSKVTADLSPCHSSAVHEDYLVAPSRDWTVTWFSIPTQKTEAP